MICHVDASFRNNKSYHAFTVRSWEGKMLYKKSFEGFETRSTEAELSTIIKALQFFKRKKLTNIRILTDCKNIVEAVNQGRHENIDVTYLKFLLKETGSTLRWIPRERNKFVDKMCRNVHKPRIKKGLMIK